MMRIQHCCELHVKKYQLLLGHDSSESSVGRGVSYVQPLSATDTNDIAIASSRIMQIILRVQKDVFDIPFQVHAVIIST